MAKFRVSIDGSLLKVNSKLTFGEKINQRELNILESQLFRGCFRPKWDGKKKIVYTAPEAISLKKYLEQPLTQPAFYRLLEQISQMAKRIESAGLYLPNLLLHMDYVFVSERTEELFFIYQPIISKYAGGNVHMFVEELVQQFEKNNGALVEAAGPDTYEKSPRQQGGDSATTLLAGGTDETVPLRGEETTLLVEEKVPHLCRVRTNESVAVKGAVFKIGKSGDSDFVITENKAISRTHAIIENRNGCYYLIDQNSTNHSYVNDKRLEPGREVELKYNDRIRLADEEFCFEE